MNAQYGIQIGFVGSIDNGVTQVLESNIVILVPDKTSLVIIKMYTTSIVGYVPTTSKMLGEAVGRLKGEEVYDDFSTVINLDIDAYIPQEYIFNEEQKLDMYKRIASVETQADLGDMKDELLDRFGKIPLSAENLLRVAYMRRLGHNIYMTEIKGGKGEITFSFKADAKVDPNRIPKILAKHKRHLSFSANGRVPTFTYLYTPETLVEKEEQNLMALTEMLLDDMQVMKLDQ